MPAPASVDELIDLIRKSKLLEPARLDGYLASNPGPYDSPKSLCNKMKADGLLSQFHVSQLLLGRYRGFFLGKYRIVDRIGLGGMGQVFLGEHQSMKRRAALKVLPPDKSKDEFSRERFYREARAAGNLEHPNLVKAYDVDEDGGVMFLTMEYVDGVTMHDLVSRFGPMEQSRAAHYIRQAAMGLEYMSANGLVHRDIKPANLLVDRSGVVKILDLGLVRSEDEGDELTRGEGVQILGTADYLAPEQAINCSQVDTRADIYALGATAFFMLTGKPPFEGNKVTQKLLAHQVKPIQPIHELRSDVSRELSDIIVRMMAKKREDRFQTATELIAALEPLTQIAPAPPTDQEIPVTATSGGAVSFQAKLQKSGVGSHSGVGAAMSSASGSAIRYQSDSSMKMIGGYGVGTTQTPVPQHTPGPGAVPGSAPGVPESHAAPTSKASDTFTPTPLSHTSPPARTPTPILPTSTPNIELKKPASKPELPKFPQPVLTPKPPPKSVPKPVVSQPSKPDSGGFGGLPPILPASSTHGLSKPAEPASPFALPNRMQPAAPQPVLANPASSGETRRTPSRADFALDQPKKKPNVLLIGAAVGVLLAVVAFAVAYFTGMMPN